MITDHFTKGEQALLRRFVTNVDKPVFVLFNLPEAIKGALFSRYSRTTKGLRRVLIDEFLNNPEGGFSAGAAKDSSEGMVNITKAQEFYDRILDGFGDDSIGELGGAHLALEQVSNIATKAIEDCRIGGSPLEKSSRYVRFDQKVKGSYQYYREPRIIESKHADSYTKMMDSLFKTYSGMIEPMTSFVRELLPCEEGTPKWAYNASVKSKALDAIRGLLPASTLTNLGLFGNGRFFESLLIKLKTNPLQEMRGLGRLAQDELDKVIPSFVRRAKYNNKHFPAMAEHRRKVSAGIQESSLELRKISIESSAEGDVVLADYDEDAEDYVLTAALYPELHLPFPQLLKHVRALAPEQRDKILDSYLAGRQNRRHKPGRALEHAYYTFDILADFGAYRDLQRHRMLTQQRQLLSTNHGYVLPELVSNAGLEREYKCVMDSAAEVYKKIAADFPREAQYAVPFGYRVRWYFSINLRALVWLCELRSMAQGHPAYRRIAQQMYHEVECIHPRLARCFKFVDLNDYPLGRLESEVRQEKRKKVTEQVQAVPR